MFNYGTDITAREEKEEEEKGLGYIWVVRIALISMHKCGIE